MAPLVVRLGGRKKFNTLILNLDGVQRVVSRVAREEEGKARATLAKHRKSGAHSVYAYSDRHTRVIALEGPAPMSIQYGHHLQDGRFVSGLRVLPTTPGNGPNN